MRFLTKLFNILTDPDTKLDLFAAYPRFKLLFYNQRLHFIWRGFLLFILLTLILVGIYGPQDPEYNCILYLCWGLWWPAVLFSLLFVGRVWCGVCPFPIPGRFLQSWHISLGKTVPKLLIKYSTPIAVIFFMLIVWVEESTGMKENPKATAYLILVIFSGALFCSLIFTKQAWCQYFCPLGKIMGIGSSISWLEFRPNHQKCRQCTTFSCRDGLDNKPGCPVSLGAIRVTNNLECHVCGRCMQLCPHDSPQLNIRFPLNEIIIRKGKFITCTLMIPFLIGSHFARFLDHDVLSIMDHIEKSCMHDWVCQMGLYAIPLALGFAVVYMIISLGDLVFGVYDDELLGSFSPMVPVFLPLAFAGEVVSRMNYTIANSPEFLPTIGRQFGWDALTHLTFTVPVWFYPIYGISIMFVAELAGLYILEKFVEVDFDGLIAEWRYRIIQITFFLLFAIYLLIMSTGWDISFLNILFIFQDSPLS